MHPVVVYGCVLLTVATALAADPGAAIRGALESLQRGDFASAERTLRPVVNASPKDGAALTLLGVALDGQRKFTEADVIHRRATAAVPASPDAWNNYANHLLNVGDPVGAQQSYLRVVQLDPSHANANIQLAQFALRESKGADALLYLQHLPGPQFDSPQIAPLRIAALYLASETQQGDALAAAWLKKAKSDAGLSLTIGRVLADAGQFQKAEEFLTQALAIAPSDFNILVNLGIAAWRGNHLDRARDALEAAHRQQPKNVDALYYLACVHQSANQPEAAVALLAEAGRLAPDRADVQKLLAITTGDLGAVADSVAAWERYIRLAPNDDTGRRERGLMSFQMGKFEEGLADLRWFVQRHPEDAVGHFELGAALNKDSSEQALGEFDRALKLNPKFPAAHSARGSIYYQMGKPEAALADLEAAAALRPDDAIALDRLGQTYLALERAPEAVRVLRRAAELAPDDSKTQLHLARALSDAGMSAESRAAMERFRQLGPAVNKPVPGGLIDFLALSPEQRRADYRKRLERSVREHPEDGALQVAWIKELIDHGERNQAAMVGVKFAQSQPKSAFLAEAGRALLYAEQYSAAQALLSKARVATPPADVDVELAVATSHTSSTAEGLRMLDQIAPSRRSANYYLARGDMLAAQGDTNAARSAVEEALRTSAEPATYRGGLLLLLRHGRAQDALGLSTRAVEELPANRVLLLTRSVVLNAAGQADDALQLVEQIRERWPEWAPGWVANALLLQERGRTAEGSALLKTAVVLGAPDDLPVRMSSTKPPGLFQILFLSQPPLI